MELATKIGYSIFVLIFLYLIFYGQNAQQANQILQTFSTALNNQITALQGRPISST